MVADEPAEPEPRDMKTLRADHPSGWLLLTKNQTVPYVIDALLEGEPGWEFNQQELADSAGVHRNSLSKYFDLLLDLEILAEVPDTHPPRYRVNIEGSVTQELYRLNSAVNTMGFDNNPGLDEAEVGPSVRPFRPAVDQGSGSEGTLVQLGDLVEG